MIWSAGFSCWRRPRGTRRRVGTCSRGAGRPHCFVCATIADVCREASLGAGAALVTAESVLGDAEGLLAGSLKAQPPWSDLPLIVLTPAGEDSPRLLRALDAVGHTTLMKRPVQVSTLLSTVRAALRDRQRQYAVRDLLAERQRDADALRIERERYRVTLSSIGDGVIATDTEGRVTFLNPVAERLTGWESDAARARPLEEVFRIVNEATRREVENPALRALEEGVAVGLANHTVLIARDGTERPLDDSAAPIQAGGEVSGAVLVFRDVTEKKSAEAAVRESELRFRALVNATSDVVYRMSGDWAEMQPLDGRGLVASNADPIRDWMQKNLPAFEHPRVRDAINRAIANKSTFELEHQVNRPDGTLGWTFSRAVPILDAAGNIVEWFGTARDITNQKHAEQELVRVTAESERQRRMFDTALSNTADFVYLFGLDHRFTYANDGPARRCGARTVTARSAKNFLELGYRTGLARRDPAGHRPGRRDEKADPGRGPVSPGTHGAPDLRVHLYARVWGRRPGRGGRRHPRPPATLPSARRWRTLSARPTARRTTSSRCWPTNCAIRWPPSATACR